VAPPPPEEPAVHHALPHIFVSRLQGFQQLDPTLPFSSLEDASSACAHMLHECHQCTCRVWTQVDSKGLPTHLKNKIAASACALPPHYKRTCAAGLTGRYKLLNSKCDKDFQLHVGCAHPEVEQGRKCRQVPVGLSGCAGCALTKALALPCCRLVSNSRTAGPPGSTVYGHQPESRRSTLCYKMPQGSALCMPYRAVPSGPACTLCGFFPLQFTISCIAQVLGIWLKPPSCILCIRSSFVVLSSWVLLFQF
jgi:hypothetical protein